MAAKAKKRKAKKKTTKRVSKKTTGKSTSTKRKISARSKPTIEPRQVTAEIIDNQNALAPTDPVTRYIQEISRYPLLKPDEEKEIAVRYREKGDPKDAELLVTSNLRFVVKVAMEYSKFGARVIDLIQEGNVGLMHAVKEFNPYKGVRLITYAVWWIRGYIQDYLMRQYSMVRIGTTQAQRKLFYRLQKEKQALVAAGEEPTPALISSRLGVPEKDVVTMEQRLASKDLSLDAPVDADGRSTMLDLQPQAQEQMIDDDIAHREDLVRLTSNIEDLKNSLNERELFLLEKRLLSDEPLTLQEIGEKYQVTREAVRQMESRLLKKIKDKFVNS